jgi:hypothetical protein
MQVQVERADSHLETHFEPSPKEQARGTEGENPLLACKTCGLWIRQKVQPQDFSKAQRCCEGSDEKPEEGNSGLQEETGSLHR